MCSPPIEGKKRIVCSNCGGDDVRRDAWAVFNTETQEWELGELFDEPYCNDCEASWSLEEVPL